MKKLIKALLLILTMSFCVSCAPQNGGADESPRIKLTATIEQIFDRIEVNVIESEYTSGILWVITSADTVFIGKDGERITRDDLAVGDTLEITYGGQVMMSYPAQIVAREIRVIEK